MREAWMRWRNDQSQYGGQFQWKPEYLWDSCWMHRTQPKLPEAVAHYLPQPGQLREKLTGWFQRKEAVKLVLGGGGNSSCTRVSNQNSARTSSTDRVFSNRPSKRRSTRSTTVSGQEAPLVRMILTGFLSGMKECVAVLSLAW